MLEMGEDTMDAYGLITYWTLCVSFVLAEGHKGGLEAIGNRTWVRDRGSWVRATRTRPLLDSAGRETRLKVIREREGDGVLSIGLCLGYCFGSADGKHSLLDGYQDSIAGVWIRGLVFCALLSACL
jgi:hypothetical protein